MIDKINVEGNFRFFENKNGRYVFRQLDNFNHITKEYNYTFYTDTKIYNNSIGDLVVDGHMIEGIQAWDFFPEEIIINRSKYWFIVKIEEAMEYLESQDFTNKEAVKYVFNAEKTFRLKNWSWKDLGYIETEDRKSFWNDQFTALDLDKTVYKKVIISQPYEIMVL